MDCASGRTLHLKQMLVNLLSNACKFTNQGAVTLRAVRERASDGEWIEFEISDTGRGMT